MISKFKYLLMVSMFFLVSVLIAFNTINIYKEKRIDTILDIHTNKVQIYYEILQHNQKITADVTFEETIENKEFMEILKKANDAYKKKQFDILAEYRNEAKELLEYEYSLYRKKGVLQYHFVFPDNIAFLRMHKPSKFGDDLTSVRSDFNYVNRSLKIVRGFAQGRTAHAFRNVYPILDKQNNHLGAVEISFSSELIQNYFTEVNKIHTHFLVKKDIFRSHAWKRDDLILKYNQSSEHDNYMITMTKNHTVGQCIVDNGRKIEPIKSQIKEMMDKGEKFSTYVLYNDKARVASFFPVFHNITKKPVAWIVSYTNEPLIDETHESSFILYILTFIGLLAVFGFIYFILDQKNILNSMVEEKTQNLIKLNRELEESEYELQIINENLETRVAEEVKKSREKDKILFENTKMAALGEMIGNIAHQWRQPLSAISTGVSGMQVQKEYGTLKDEDFDKTCEQVIDNANYLSKTIDDFRNFVRGDSKKERFNLKESVDSFLSLVASSVKEHSINIITDIPEELQLKGLKNELNQCLINLFNNAKDKLAQEKIKRYILIKAKKKNGVLRVVFQDNGGGIDENIIEKVFEPYFTTKHKSQGTGLGLNMTYRLIVEGMHGTITVSNDTFTADGKEHKGAKFIINIPLELGD